jgi:hypothetical protein
MEQSLVLATPTSFHHQPIGVKRNLSGSLGGYGKGQGWNPECGLFAGMMELGRIWCGLAPTLRVAPGAGCGEVNVDG